MNTNRHVFWNSRPPPAARLGGVGWVDDHLSTDAISLVVKHLPEQAKPSIVRRQGQVVVSVHKGQGEVFNRNQVIFGDESGTDLMQVIRPLMSDARTPAGHLSISFRWR